MKSLCLALLFFVAHGTYGQSAIINSPFLVSSAGDTWIQENYNLCFSLGEIAIETYAQESIILTQGFHQENNYQITALNEAPNYQINVYPNPTPDILNITCDAVPLVAINIKDTKGSIVSFLKVSLLNKHYSIDLSNFSAGMYFLEALLSSGEKQVYQIQKFN